MMFLLHGTAHRIARDVWRPFEFTHYHDLECPRFSYHRAHLLAWLGSTDSHAAGGVWCKLYIKVRNNNVSHFKQLSHSESQLLLPITTTCLGSQRTLLLSNLPCIVKTIPHGTPSLNHWTQKAAQSHHQVKDHQVKGWQWQTRHPALHHIKRRNARKRVCFLHSRHFRLALAIISLRYRVLAACRYRHWK